MQPATQTLSSYCPQLFFYENKQLIGDIYGIGAAKSYDFIIAWTQIPEVNKHLVFIFGFVKISTEKPLINKAVYC